MLTEQHEVANYPEREMNINSLRLSNLKLTTQPSKEVCYLIEILNAT